MCLTVRGGGCFPACITGHMNRVGLPNRPGCRPPLPRIRSTSGRLRILLECILVLKTYHCPTCTGPHPTDKLVQVGPLCTKTPLDVFKIAHYVACIVGKVSSWHLTEMPFCFSVISIVNFSRSLLIEEVGSNEHESGTQIWHVKM